MMERIPAYADLRARRLDSWRQTAGRHIAGPDEAVELINTFGLITLYPVSPEIPNLYHAYVGDPGRPTEMKWDSPTGEVYTWRWILGRREVACYSVVVRKRPTWIAWDTLPAVLRLLSDTRMPDELMHLGVISPEAYRIAQALEEAERPLNTSELREAARFPTGKEQRAAYQKALAELDARLLLARVFSKDARAASDPKPGEGGEATEGESTGMGHALFSVTYREYMNQADRMSRDEALDQILMRYLPGAIWATTRALARALGLPQTEVEAGMARLQERGQAQPLTLKEIAGPAWLWTGD